MTLPDLDASKIRVGSFRPGVTAVMVPYNNEDGTLLRLAGLAHALRYCELDAELIVIDNGDSYSARIAAAVADSGIPGRYCWQNENLMYGPGINEAVRLAKHPRLIYVCSNHGESRDPTWPLDLLAPLADEGVAMAGTIAHSGPPEPFGYASGTPQWHVQGGVYAARADVLRDHPYPEGEHAHSGSDVHLCFELVTLGYRLVDVPTIRSTWREPIGEGPWKYVHTGG